MTDVVDFAPEHKFELVRLWRASFEEAVGIVDPHPLEEQGRYFDEAVLPKNRVVVVLEEGTVVAFLAHSRDAIAQLYVRLDRQGLGLGTMLLDRAKRESGGRLRLFTFLRNVKARRFYERRGFREVRRGFEPEWKLEDVEFEWVRSTEG